MDRAALKGRDWGEGLAGSGGQGQDMGPFSPGPSIPCQRKVPVQLPTAQWRHFSGPATPKGLTLYVVSHPGSRWADRQTD